MKAILTTIRMTESGDANGLARMQRALNPQKLVHDIRAMMTQPIGSFTPGAREAIQNFAGTPKDAAEKIFAGFIPEFAGRLLSARTFPSNQKAQLLGSLEKYGKDSDHLASILMHMSQKMVASVLFEPARKREKVIKTGTILGVVGSKEFSPLAFCNLLSVMTKPDIEFLLFGLPGGPLSADIISRQLSAPANGISRKVFSFYMKGNRVDKTSDGFPLTLIPSLIMANPDTDAMIKAGYLNDADRVDFSVVERIFAGMSDIPVKKFWNIKDLTVDGMIRDIQSKMCTQTIGLPGLANTIK